MDTPLIVIPCFIKKKRHAELLIGCLQSLRATADAEVLLVDDASPAENIKSFYTELTYSHNVQVHTQEKNSGFATAVNVGLKKALEEKRDACLVNQDIQFVEEGWLEDLGNTDADIIGPLLLYPNLLIQSAGTYFSSFSRNFEHRFVGSAPNLPAAQKEAECPVTAALQYIKYPVLEKVGLFDESFFMGYEDVDYLIRAIKAGFKSVYNPNIKALHHESTIRTRKSDNETRSYLRLIEKYHGVDFDGVPTVVR